MRTGGQSQQAIAEVKVQPEGFTSTLTDQEVTRKLADITRRVSRQDGVKWLTTTLVKMSDGIIALMDRGVAIGYGETSVETVRGVHGLMMHKVAVAPNRRHARIATTLYLELLRHIGLPILSDYFWTKEGYALWCAFSTSNLFHVYAINKDGKKALIEDLASLDRFWVSECHFMLTLG